MPASEIDLIFIGGASRTGSTLLSLLLSALPGHFSAGEIRYVWLRGLKANQLCGCGEPFRSCPFWREVISTALGPIDDVDADRYVHLWREVASPRAVLRSVGPESTAKTRRRHEYMEAVRRVLLAIHRATGGEVIVDSSKYATDCLLLSRLPGVRLHATHLVRDSRAVAYSWQRRKRRPEIHWREQDMSLFSPWRSSFDWGSMNVVMELVGRGVDRYDRIRYEDLVRDPAGVLSTLLPDEPPDRIEKILSSSAPLAGGHTVSGNPLRFDRGPVTIRPDFEWVTKIDFRDRRLVTTLTWPLLLRYGYPLLPRDEME